MTIFEALREDHDHQRTLVTALIETSGDETERARLFDELKVALETHALGEERYFYAPLMKADLTQVKARHSVAEHKELDDLVATLASTDRSSSGWLTVAKQLHERLLHHLEEEEREVFQLAGRTLSDAQKRDLAHEYRRAMQATT
jgi:hemerythrin-like domain-containing protein